MKKGIKIYLAFLLILLSVFGWAGLSGTRLLGDGKTVFEPEGQPNPRSSSGIIYYRSSRFYHK